MDKAFKKNLKEHFDIEVISLMALDIHAEIIKLPKQREDFQWAEQYHEYVMKKIRPVIKEWVHGNK